VIMRINEAHDLGEITRFAFYEHCKVYLAAPPDTLLIDEKNTREYYVPNVTGVVITTNYKTDGIYLPAGDRRHYVASSDCVKEDFSPGYWHELHNWYQAGGNSHVAAYLAAFDLTDFDPKAPPPQTAAFSAIVAAGRPHECAELADLLDRLGNPDVITAARAANEASGDFQIWMRDRKNRKAIPHRFEQCGYDQVPNDDAQDHLWKINGARQVVYAKKLLTKLDQLSAVRRLIGTGQ
jgi:hypothetical protein